MSTRYRIIITDRHLRPLFQKAFCLFTFLFIITCLTLAQEQEKMKTESLLPSDRANTNGVRFGITADPHLQDEIMPRRDYFLSFVKAMQLWRPDFVIDLGDFAVAISSGPPTTLERHDRQLRNLKLQWAVYSQLPCPAYLVIGNHDVGWIKGGKENITADDLYLYNEGRHGGEHITKDEFLAVTKMPGRYYSFDVKGYHFIVLDGNNWRGPTTVPSGHDGVAGAYWIDDEQRAWLAEDLKANRNKTKVVFCHEELHHTPLVGSGQGGDQPFPPVGKEASYVDNGWQVRQLLAEDGKVVACFFGHKHESRWTVYDGVHYITLQALHDGGSYAKVTLSDKLYIEGVGKQKNLSLKNNVNDATRKAIPYQSNP